MNNVLIQGLDFSRDELTELNIKNKYDIIFSVYNPKSLLDPSAVLIFIELAKSIGFDAIYDTLKYILKCILSKTEHLENKKTRITVNCGKKKSSINVNFPLTETQKDKIIDAVIKKFIDD